jgi:tryptophan synthase alpha chain
MSRLDDAFADASHRDELALVAYLTAGYPTPDETVGLMATAVDRGADVIELGVPFSDPMGDGPTIQASSQAALAAGMTLHRAIETVAEARESGVTVPIVLMGYCNPFLQRGLVRLFRDAHSAGIDGFVVPDLPAHEAGEWLEGANRYGLDMVFFAAPGSRPERLALNVSRSRGFLYCLATDGATGARDELDPRLDDYLLRLRAATTLPLAVGFGISQPRHIAALKGKADGAIVGSAIVHRLAAAGTPAQRRCALAGLVTELKAACR